MSGVIQLIFVSITLTDGYLPTPQIIALQNFYDSLNGDKWTQCTWNITQLATNTTLPPYYCGLATSPVTSNIQTVWGIKFYFDNHLNGTIPNSIGKLTDLQGIAITNNELLTGSIPNTICNLTQFVAIDFVNVNLFGSVPICIGNISSLRWILLHNIPSLSMTDDIIELLCVNAKSMDTIHLTTINYTGSISQCIGIELLQLQYIVFTDLPQLNSSIPDTFNDLAQIVWLELRNLPNLYGSIQSQFLKNNNFQTLQISDTSLSGDINLNDLCTCSNLYVLQIENNPFLSLHSVPDCMQSWNKLQFLAIAGSSSMYGTISDSICYLKDLVGLYIYNTSVYGSIPKCVGGNLTNLIDVQIHTNKLKGTFPSISSPHLKVLDIHNNAFENSISSILPLEKYPNLEVVAFHKNNFFDDNIGKTINKIFKYSPNIKAITLYDNEYIGGKLPTFDQDIFMEQLVVFAAHDLNIGGVIPNNLHFRSTHKSILSLYDNQLSSKLPSALFINSQNITPIILRGNLFTIYDDHSIPEWMDESKFIKSKQLYITTWDIIKNWFILIVGFISLTFAFIKRIYGLRLYSDNPFIQHIKNAEYYINDRRLLVLVVILLIFYPFSCSYYSSSSVLSYFSLFFFQTDNIYIMMTLGILLIIYNIIILDIVSNIMGKTFVANEHEIDIDRMLTHKLSSEMPSIQEPLLSQEEEKYDQSYYTCLVRLIQVCFYFILYVASIMVLILYILTKSLPDDNTLSINSVEQNLISYSVQSIFAFNTSIIIPLFIESVFALFRCKQTSIRTSSFIMITRTLTTIIIPVTVSALLLNECGNGWVMLWRPCANDRDSFNIKYPIQPSKSPYNVTVDGNITQTGYISSHLIDLTVLTESDVCDITSFNNILWNKCIRSFLFKWCILLMIKMIIIFFMPIFIIIWKSVKSRLLKNKSSKSITINSEYAMLATKLEIVLSFGIFCPLLYPLVIISINSFILFYQTTIHRLKWKVKFFNHDGLKSFPFKFLWFGIFVQQIITFLLFKTDPVMYHMDKRNIFPWTLFSAYILIDIYFIFKILKT